jgi:coatomer protein complex subunit epsilon
MDPYSPEGELINIHNAFHQGQYDQVIDYDTSSLSPENQLPARVLQLRARIALGQADDVVDEIADEDEAEYKAVGALAAFARGEKDDAVKTIEELAGSDDGNNAVVQVLGGTVLAAGGKSDEALALLGRHQGNRMCVVSDFATASMLTGV